MLGEVMGRNIAGGSNSSLFFLLLLQIALGKLGVGTTHPGGSVDGGPCALGFLDFCLGSANPWARPHLPISPGMSPTI